MTKSWKISLNLIGGIQIIIGILIIYFNVKLILHVLELIKDFNDIDREINGFDVFKRFQFMLVVGLLFIIAGILLILSKKIGWVTSLSVWITFAFSFVSLITFKDVTTTVLLEDNSDYWLIGFLISTLIGSVIVLLLKPIRDYYQINKNSWLYVGVILFCFLLNKILI